MRRGSVKARRRGCTGGQLLVGLAAAQLAGEDFVIGLDRQRTDVAGQSLASVPGLGATTAAGLGRALLRRAAGSRHSSPRSSSPSAPNASRRCGGCSRASPTPTGFDAIGMDGAQVAVAPYAPNWWSAATQMLIRRVRLTRAQISACPRRRRTLHPDQRALPISERAVAVYGYSFIATNLDVSTWTKLPAWSTGTGTAPRSEVAG